MGIEISISVSIPKDDNLKGMDENLIALRRDYLAATLEENTADPNPLNQFAAWMQQALSANVLDVEAMTLSTVSPTGDPSARIVLLRGYDARGFSFYTNYQSDKGQHLAANPRCSLVFHWREIERQVRIQGAAHPVSPEESSAYFATRPRGSQLGAWASNQSKVLENRQDLEQSWQSLDAQYKDREIPRPDFWGGYRVVPTVFEFWQGRRSRLHDRLRYTQTPTGWSIHRLAP
jgi:pyridoxamine 5'-phosphate oxidase